jgi:mono/diheme cytochrome c family protein
MKKPLIIALRMFTLAATLLAVGSCASDPDSSGLEYMPDMYRSPAIEPNVDYGEIRGREHKEFKTILSSMTPPNNTVPYYGTDSTEVKFMLPYTRKASFVFRETHGLFGFDFSMADEYTLAAADKTNPYTITPVNAPLILASGKEIYTAMCQHCHGEKGDGQGPMVLSGAYVGVPSYAERAALSEGQIFYSIYYGKNMMGAHGSILNKKEIWTLVHYVRQFQRADYGKFDANGKPMTAAVADSTAKKTK